MSNLRDLPEVSCAIIWAKQIEKQLNAYMRRVEDVFGKGWERLKLLRRTADKCWSLNESLADFIGIPLSKFQSGIMLNPRCSVLRNTPKSSSGSKVIENSGPKNELGLFKIFFFNFEFTFINNLFLFLKLKLKISWYCSCSCIFRSCIPRL